MHAINKTLSFSRLFGNYYILKIFTSADESRLRTLKVSVILLLIKINLFQVPSLGIRVSMGGESCANVITGVST